MKSAYLLFLTLVTVVFLGFLVPQAHADYTNGISIQSVNVQPSVLKVGNTFSVTATLVNNSTIPIAVDGGTCITNRYQLVPFFTVNLDDHAKIKAQNLTCAGVGLGKILNHGESLSGTSPDSTFSYIATKSGTASVTVTFSYHGINQTDPTQGYAEQTISKSFQFTIADNGISTSYGGLTGYRQAYFQANHDSYPIWYKITNGTVVSTLLDLPAKALLFEINTTSNGQLTVDLPRTIMDSKNGSDDVPYFVSVYDIRSLGGPTKISPKEINNNDIRILKINFTKDITEIEIVGTFFVEKYHYAAPNSISSLSPLKQYETGLAAKDVVCKSDFQLVIKSSDGSPACVKPEHVTRLIQNGWAKEVSQTSLHTIPIVSSASCDIPYPQSNTGVAVLYMPTNSTGKICATYYNPDSPIQSSIRVFAAKDVQQMASNIITSVHPDIVPTGNNTMVYDIKTGNQAGLYGVSFFCSSIPLVVGYDDQSRIILDDFPWLYKNDLCLSQKNVFQITGLSGIHVQYVTEVHRG